MDVLSEAKLKSSDHSTLIEEAGRWDEYADGVVRKLAERPPERGDGGKDRRSDSKMERRTQFQNSIREALARPTWAAFQALSGLQRTASEEQLVKELTRRWEEAERAFLATLRKYTSFRDRVEEYLWEFGECVVRMIRTGQLTPSEHRGLSTLPRPKNDSPR